MIRNDLKNNFLTQLINKSAINKNMLYNIFKIK